MAIAAIDVTFQARPDERFLFPTTPVAGPRRFVGVLGACLVYAIVLTPVVVEDLLRTPPAPAVQEIPVEIVIQPPPETPQQEKPPDPPAPKFDPKPFDEKPAVDAPRASNNEKVDDSDSDKLMKSPLVKEEKPVSAKPDPTPNPDAGHDAPKPQAEAASNAPPLDAPQSPTGEFAVEKPAQPERQAKVEEPPIESHAAAGAEKFPTFASVPDVDFGALAKAAPIAGGKAKATYLSIIYGMIAARAPSIRAKIARSGEIIFSLDSMGGLIERKIYMSSGSRERDAEAFEAIRKAAPFPPPPTHAPMDFTLTY
jgi:TonB family protein